MKKAEVRSGKGDGVKGGRRGVGLDVEKWED
jgi:hypothetical protein